MLLDLYWRESQGLRTSLTSLWLASKASEMTGRRCLAVMEEQGIVERMPDPSDGRRVNVRFTPEGRKKMEACFSALLRQPLQSSADFGRSWGCECSPILHSGLFSRSSKVACRRIGGVSEPAQRLIAPG